MDCRKVDWMPGDQLRLLLEEKVRNIRIVKLQRQNDK